MSPDEPILSSEEIAALSGGPEPAFSAFAEESFEQPTQEVAAYDLTSEDRPVRGHLPALDFVHTLLAEHLSGALTRALGSPVEVQAEDTQLTKLGAALSFVPSPSCIGILELLPLGEPALLVIDPSLVLALMTRFYGGTDSLETDGTPLGSRPLTPLERGFGRYVCERFGDAMEASWTSVAPMRSTVSSIELSPRFASIVPGGDVVVTAVFEVTAGSVSGQLQFVIPYASLSPYHRELQSSVRHGSGTRARGWQEQIEDHISDTQIEIMAELGHTTLTMSRLASLRPGQVLRLGADRMSPVVLYVEGAPKLLGRLTVVNGNIAFRVERRLDSPTAGAGRIVKPTEESTSDGEDPGPDGERKGAAGAQEEAAA